MKKIVFFTVGLSLALLSISGINCWRSKAKKNMHTTKDQNMTRVTTPSGLTYEILQEGNGQIAQKGQKVTVHYTGWLQNKDGSKGSQFDSSRDRGTPFSFMLGAGQVIKGWDEGVVGMKIGEQRHLIIPSGLGYGPHGFPGAIPGGATLLFDVELISVG